MFYVTTKRKKRRRYLKWFEAWGHLKLNAILFQSWSKIRSNSKLPSIIVTNISRSPPHTTSWFTEVRHPHLKTNRQGLLSHVHILMVSKSNLKLQVFGLFWNNRRMRRRNTPGAIVLNVNTDQDFKEGI